MHRFFAILTAFLLFILAAACTRSAPCASVSASAQDTTAASDSLEDDSDDPSPGCPAGLNCGDYGACRDPLPVCCRGVCQREACK